MLGHPELSNSSSGRVAEYSECSVPLALSTPFSVIRQGLSGICLLCVAGTLKASS